MRYLFVLLCFARALGASPQQADSVALAKEGFEHFYNLEYDQALTVFERASQAAPDNAEIHNNIAQTLLYREMFRNGALESELVSGNNAFLRRPKLNPSPETQQRFDSEIGRAIELSQAEIAKNPKDIHALYTLGVTYGLRSNYNFLVRKAWRDALRDATEARKLHNKVTELDPSNYDARLVQGVHDYVVGSLPWGWRMLGFVVGFRGDRDGGIKTLESVAAKGNKNRVDAEILLCALYRREGRAKDALPLLDDLLRRYPRDYLLVFEKAQMYSALGKKQEALSALKQIEDLKNTGSPGFARVPFEKIWYEQGNIQFWYNDLDSALANLKKATANASDLDLNSEVLAWMRQGQIYDLTNRRELARHAYQKAITSAPDSDVAKESRRYLSDPYRRKES